MKKIMLSLFVSVLAVTSYAQIKTPAASTSAKIEQVVGLTKVTIEYSRPNVRARKIFGDLVSYGQVWRTGANANTKITFDTDFTVGGTTLKAGTYAIYTKPGEKSWDIILYTDATNWGNPQTWDDAKVAATIKADVYPMPMTIETFTITFDDVASASATVGILWENVYVGLPFTVPTDAAVLASIDATLKGTPTARDYYSAAVYFLEEGKNITKAVTWIDKAVEMSKEDPKFWMYRQQSLIHAKAGMKKTAIAAAKTSLELAKKANNADYVKMNTDSLKEWGAM